MEFSFIPLGIASAVPNGKSFPSAHVLNVRGRLFLIDCAEGTQMQLSRYKLSHTKIHNIMISHLHGDHCFGLYPLLSTMMLKGRTDDINIYGPEGIKEYIDFFIRFFGDGLLYKINVFEMNFEGIQEIIRTNQLVVSAFKLKHGVPTYGFRFDYIKRTIPRSFAYCSDTAPFKELPQYVENVNLLYHEATFANEHTANAEKYFHSTSSQAANIALAANVGKLLIGHFSSRYIHFGTILEEVKAVFNNSDIARVGETIEISKKMTL